MKTKLLFAIIAIAMLVGVSGAFAQQGIIYVNYEGAPVNPLDANCIDVYDNSLNAWSRVFDPAIGGPLPFGNENFVRIDYMGGGAGPNNNMILVADSVAKASHPTGVLHMIDPNTGVYMGFFGINNTTALVPANIRGISTYRTTGQWDIFIAEKNAANDIISHWILPDAAIPGAKNQIQPVAMSAAISGHNGNIEGIYATPAGNPYVLFADGAVNNIYDFPAGWMGGVANLIDTVNTRSAGGELAEGFDMDASAKYWAYNADPTSSDEANTEKAYDANTVPDNWFAIPGNNLFDGGITYGLLGWTPGVYVNDTVPLGGQGEVYAEVYGTVAIAFQPGNRSVAWTGIPGQQFNGSMAFNNTGTGTINVDILLVPASSAGFFGYPDLSQPGTDPNFWFRWNASVVSGAATTMNANWFSQTTYQSLGTGIVSGTLVKIDLTLQTATNTSIRSELAKVVLQATDATESIENEYLNVETANMAPVSSGMPQFIGMTSGINASVNCREATFAYGDALALKGYALIGQPDCTITWNTTKGSHYTYYNETVDFCVRIVQGLRGSGPVDVKVYDSLNSLICNFTATASGVGNNNVSETCCVAGGYNTTAWNPQWISAVMNMSNSVGNVDAMRVVRDRS